MWSLDSMDIVRLKLIKSKMGIVTSGISSFSWEAISIPFPFLLNKNHFYCTNAINCGFSRLTGIEFFNLPNLVNKCKNSLQSNKAHSPSSLTSISLMHPLVLTNRFRSINLSIWDTSEYENTLL